MEKLETGAGPSPWVRVVIVNYNAGPLIQACVDALAAQTFKDFEAVIVDNASTDGSPDALRLPDRRFTLVRNQSNMGFAAANNIGARGCRAPWLVDRRPILTHRKLAPAPSLPALRFAARLQPWRCDTTT